TATPPAANSAPTANAGNSLSVATGTVVTLDGRSSYDPDGDALTFRWSLSSRPDGSHADLSASSIARPFFIADVPGSYVALLVVKEGKVDSAPATVVVTPATDVPPVANAGADRNVEVGTRVTLDGRASSDANGDALTNSWTLSRPAGSQASLSDGTSARPAF